MHKTTSLQVLMHGRKVGTLALTNNVAAFQYDNGWLTHGFSISPFSLPLTDTVFIPNFQPFQGLYGIFNDSLPDGWGRLLLDRMIKKLGEDPTSLTCLDRLAIVGSTALGALEYRPSTDLKTAESTENFDELARECRKIFNDEYSEDLDKLFYLAGSSGGARPKVMVDIDDDPWIVKFHTTAEGPEMGKMEHNYALCAARCGINIPETRLLPSKECPGYFAIKRFDRKTINNKTTRIHMASASALLETSHRLPNLDYTQLMKLTAALTHDNSQLEELYRRMCFNVFAHNRDDHSKNFSFLCTEQGQWSLSPAYDLTYSNSLAGEHATTVAGNGVNPGLDDMLTVAKSADLDMAWAEETANKIRITAEEDLSEYLI